VSSSMRCDAMSVVPSPPSATTRSASRTCSRVISERITLVVDVTPMSRRSVVIRST
jgi:hypothetical protein